MLKSIGLIALNTVRIVGRGTVLVPKVFYQRSKACRTFAKQLRQQGIPENAIQDLTKWYRRAHSFKQKNPPCN
jgi:hypothetical protein